MTNDDFYPEKPVLEERKPRNNVALTIFSIVLFVSTFLFLFTDEIFFVFSVLIVLIVHEMGHFLLMKRFGYKDVYMLFIPLMGAFVQGKWKFLYFSTHPDPVVVPSDLKDFVEVMDRNKMEKFFGSGWSFYRTVRSVVHQ